ncbi:MAG TPA: discoidin domain-containing protein, partial [Puia sp.]|nr:discoidin domain-containing protein [Puia sp.]
IVYYYWSNHYNHSSFNNLVITGLCGVRPSAGDTLSIHPLVDSSIHYFCLQGLSYHGHRITVVYDQDGRRYHLGKGLSVFVDGKRSNLSGKNGVNKVFIGAPLSEKKSVSSENYALNIGRQSFPFPTASINTEPDSMFQAIDGRIWYFPEITNRWTTSGSGSVNDWYALDFGKPRQFSKLAIYLFEDGRKFNLPEKIDIEYKDGNIWKPVEIKKSDPEKLVGNTVNYFSFDQVQGNGIRINFHHIKNDVALVELEVY